MVAPKAARTEEKKVVSMAAKRAVEMVAQMDY
jgi:hypothetical protein